MSAAFTCDCGHPFREHLNPDTGEFWAGDVRCLGCEDEIAFDERPAAAMCEGYMEREAA